MLAAFENSGTKSILMVEASLIGILHRQHRALVVRKQAGVTLPTSEALAPHLGWDPD